MLYCPPDGNSALPRRVLVHCHIYKNAGSSIERLLWRNFGDGFAILNAAPGRDLIEPAVLRRFLADHPHIRAVSSHHLHPPLVFSGALPIVLLRHPADRARSAYRFARRTPAMPDHAVARDCCFAEYVVWSLAGRGEGAVLHDHQVLHLSQGVRRRSDPVHWRATRADLDRALETLAALPAFGLVRRFGDSCRLFNAAYRPAAPAMNFEPWAENTTGNPAMPEAAALAQIRAELGGAVFEHLCAENVLDLELYRAATRLFDSRLARLDAPLARTAYAARFFAGRARRSLTGQRAPGSARHPLEPACITLGQR